MLLGRAIGVFPLIALLNLCRSKDRQISMGKAAAMWYAGLRGAIAVGLVVGIPTSLRYMMTSTTVTIVLLTVFVMGGTTAPFLKMCGIQMVKTTKKKKIFSFLFMLLLLLLVVFFVFFVSFF